MNLPLRCLPLMLAALLQATLITGKNDNVNGWVDLFLPIVSSELSKGSKMVKLPDLKSELNHLFITIKVSCRDGLINSVGNITRNGNVTVRKEAGWVSIRAPLTLHNLHLHYDNCVINQSILPISAPLDLWASSVSLVGSISAIQSGRNCTNELDYMVVTDLGFLHIKRGEGPIGRAGELILTAVANVKHPLLIRKINELLETAAVKALVNSENLCPQIFFLAG